MKSFSDYIVNLKNLEFNVREIRRKISKGVKLCAVVKANAYGLGAHTICKKLAKLVDFFAVANVQEALSIRVFDKTTKILILGVIDKDDYEICANNNISVSISSFEHLKECVGSVSKKTKVHIQINTGLNRFGFRSVAMFKNAVKLINDSEFLELEGVYSHFATKQNDKNFIKKQFFKFNLFRKVVKSKVIFHIANSYATQLSSQYHLNMVRTGFLMYTKNDGFKTKDILEIKSRLVNVIKVRKGESVGYDRSFVANKKMVVGILPLGYADGIDRRLSNNFSFLINGQKCSIVGKVCMDVCMIDITHINCVIGDEIVVLGKCGKKEISLQDYAGAINTSAYEILLKFRHARMNYCVID